MKKKFNLTINGKNYRNARRRSYCYCGNGKRWRKNKQTSEFNLALMGFRLREYIELTEN